MKTLIFAMFVTTSWILPASPVPAADLPRVQVAPPPVYVPPIYGPTYCRIGTERFFDGYAWRSRDVQVCR